MPTLPLYDPAPPHPDGWHRVLAPGGYELWHFDAEDDAGEVRLIVTFSQGSPFDGEYRRRYAEFLRKPTRRTPPVPAEFPGVTFLLWEKGGALARFAYRYPPHCFEASPSGPDVRIGPHRLLPGAGGTLAVTVGAVPVDGIAARASAELWFTPMLPVAPQKRRFPAREAAGADHFWVLAHPLCAVRGVVRLRDEDTAPPREVQFSGRGYRDHRYGTAPLDAAGGAKWARGRVLSENHAEVFQTFEGEMIALRADASGIQDVALQREPATSNLPELALINGGILQTPVEVDGNPFAVTRAYELLREGMTGGTALVESARHGFSFPKRAGDFVDAPEQ
jgi:hypothetical protein